MPASNTLEQAAQIPQRQLDDHWHIASLAVHARPAALEATSRWLRDHPGVEIHSSDAQGKLVVVVETQDPQRILDMIDGVQREAGALNAALVYHEKLPLAESEEEL